MEYQRVDRELQHCQKIYTAWKYVNALEQSKNADKNVEKINARVKDMEESIRNGENEAKNIEDKVEELNRKKAEVGAESSIFK